MSNLDSLISEKKEEIKKLRRDKKLAYLKKYYREVLKPRRAEETEENKMWKRIMKETMTPENIDKLRDFSNILRNRTIDKHFESKEEQN